MKGKCLNSTRLCDFGQILLCTVEREQVPIVNNVGTEKKKSTGEDWFSNGHPPTHKSLPMQFIFCLLLLAPGPVFHQTSQRLVIKIEIFSAYVFF